MKILKLLNKKHLSIFIILILSLSLNLRAEDEPVDIWALENNDEDSSSKVILENDDSSVILDGEEESYSDTLIEAIDSKTLDSNQISIVGIYDPEDNGLKIDMWSNSNGEEVKFIMNKFDNMNLSKDAKEILDIALLTNSYIPKEKISEEEFVDFKINFLIKNDDKNLIKLYLKKNEKNIYNSKLIKFYINDYIQKADVENACKIFDELNYFADDYINKFKIYCLINNNQREQAQLLFDLNKEAGLKDEFYEDKFNFLMEYIDSADGKTSEKNILNFHLSHRTNPEFVYEPTEYTPKFIWRYLSFANLLANVNTISLEDNEKITLIEKATHERNYSENELFDLYKRFQFNINQLLNAKESHKSLQNYEGRALLYQRLILTKDTKEVLDLSFRLKSSFIKDNIENAFNSELKNILSKVDEEEVQSNYSSFYFDSLAEKTLIKKNIKINNKIIHQSKLLQYFEDANGIEKVEDDLNKLLRSIKKNKDYIVSTKDLILLESLVSDGVSISKKYKNMFEFFQSNVPTDIQLLINNNEIGMVLLRLVEIIGEDDLESLDSDTLYFVSTILNEINLDSIRNKILLKVLPLKI